MTLVEKELSKLAIRDNNLWYARPETKCSGEYYSSRVKLKVNWFRLAQKIAGEKIYEYNVIIEVVKPFKGKPKAGLVPVPQRSELFWKLIRHANFRPDDFVFDDYDTVYSKCASERTEVKMKDPNKPNKHYILTIQPTKEIILDFRRDNPDRDDIANISTKFLKCLFTQKFRYVPHEKDTRAIDFTKQFICDRNAIFYIPSISQDPKIKVTPGIEGWMGIYLAIRETSDFDVVLNFGLVDRLFYNIDISLLEYIISVIMEKYSTSDRKAFCTKLSEGQYGMSKAQRSRLNNLLGGLKMKSLAAWDEKLGKFVERHLHFEHFEDKTSKCFVPIRKSSRDVTYEELYKKNNIFIHYPHLPLVRCRTGKASILLPIEALTVHEKPQRFKNMIDNTMKLRFIQGATRDPHIHIARTEEMLRKFDFDSPNMNFLGSFGVVPQLKMIECPGKVLKEPKLVNKNEEPIKLTETIRGYQEKTLNIVPQGELCCSLIVLRGDDEEMPCIDMNSLKKFYKNLIDACIARGIKVEDNDNEINRSLFRLYDNVTCYEGPTNFSAAVTDTLEMFKQLPNKDSKSLLFIVISKVTYEVYGHIKYICDTVYGVANQVVNHHTVEKAIREAEGCGDKKSDTIFWNLALKINGKLDGVNQEIGFCEDVEISAEEKEKRNSEPLKMFVGIDVTHPTQGSGIDFSIASIVASMNRGATRYRSEIVAQMEKPDPWEKSVHREKTDILEGKFVELLRQFASKNANRVPDHIVVFRDGVSDSELLKTAHDELKSLKSEVNEFYRQRNLNDKEPFYTYIVIQKRHNTRFYRISDKKEDQATNGIVNITSGTVCDKIVVSPYKFDFWLASHHGQLGTSRPAHYTVMHDDSGLVMDTCYKMCYELSFLSSRCRKPISLPVPVYYAHLQCTKAKEVYKAAKMGRAEPGIHRRQIEKVLQPNRNYPGMSFV